MGDSPKWVKSRRRRGKKEKERAKVGENNGQATHGARKHAWRTQAAWAKIVRLHLITFRNKRGIYGNSHIITLFMSHPQLTSGLDFGSILCGIVIWTDVG